MSEAWRETVAEALSEHYATGVDMGTPRQYTARGGWNVVCTCDTVIGESGDDDIKQRHNRHVADALAPTIERLLTEARAEHGERIAQAIEALPTTRTQAWLKGWDSVSQADAAHIARTATSPEASHE